MHASDYFKLRDFAKKFVQEHSEYLDTLRIASDNFVITSYDYEGFPIEFYGNDDEDLSVFDMHYNVLWSKLEIVDLRKVFFEAYKDVPFEIPHLTSADDSIEVHNVDELKNALEDSIKTIKEYLKKSKEYNINSTIFNLENC